MVVRPAGVGTQGPLVQAHPVHQVEDALAGDRSALGGPQAVHQGVHGDEFLGQGDLPSKAYDAPSARSKHAGRDWTLRRLANRAGGVAEGPVVDRPEHLCGAVEGGDVALGVGDRLRKAGDHLGFGVINHVVDKLKNKVLP